MVARKVKIAKSTAKPRKKPSLNTTYLRGILVALERLEKKVDDSITQSRIHFNHIFNQYGILATNDSNHGKRLEDHIKGKVVEPSGHNHMQPDAEV